MPNLLITLYCLKPERTKETKCAETAVLYRPPWIGARMSLSSLLNYILATYSYGIVPAVLKSKYSVWQPSARKSTFQNVIQDTADCKF